MTKRQKPSKATRIGQVPVGDVRMTANIRADLHHQLRIRAVTTRTTVGEMIERWIASWCEAGR